jgi:hypothetical protein
MVIGGLKVAPFGPKSQQTPTVLEPVGGAGDVACGVTVIVLSGIPAEVMPIVPAGMVTVALPSEDATVADASKSPLVLTMLPTETELTPVTAVGAGGGTYTAGITLPRKVVTALVRVVSAASTIDCA